MKYFIFSKEELNLSEKKLRKLAKSKLRKLILKYHPDKHQGESSENIKKFTRIMVEIINEYKLIDYSACSKNDESDESDEPEMQETNESSEDIDFDLLESAYIESILNLTDKNKAKPVHINTEKVDSIITLVKIIEDLKELDSELKYHAIFPMEEKVFESEKLHDFLQVTTYSPKSSEQIFTECHKELQENVKLMIAEYLKQLKEL